LLPNVDLVGGLVDADLDTLATALYVKIDDLRSSGRRAAYLTRSAAVVLLAPEEVAAEVAVELRKHR
jgi:hypothetical protein